MDKNTSGTVFVLAFVLATAQIRAATVAYKNLATTRLPYGEAIAISGNTQDFVVTDAKLGKLNVVDWIAIQKISVIVTVAGTTARAPVDATISGTSWTANVEPFPKNASVTFDFKVTGDLTGSQAGSLAARLVENEDFRNAVSAFFTKGARAASSSVIDDAKAAFADAAAPVLRGLLPAFLASIDVKTVSESLKKSHAGEIGLLNVRNDLNSLIAYMNAVKVTDLAGVNASSSVSDACTRLKGIKEGDVKSRATSAAGTTPTPGQLDGLWLAIQPLNDDCAASGKNIADIGKGLIADISVSLDLTEITTVQDFAKYAGIDVGALYAPPVSTLRSFFTVNVYLGAVEDSPAPVTPCSADATPAVRWRQIADAQKRVEDAKALEQGTAAELKTRQAALSALESAVNKDPGAATPAQVARAARDVSTSQRLADAATSARQQAEQAAADILAPPAGTSQGRACTFWDSSFWQVFQQRFSVSGGISLGDISGQQDPPFKQNYAFVFGGGWRLNKYVRLFAGDLLYRNKISDRMNHAFCFGVSTDVAALGNITGLFGKVK